MAEKQEQVTEQEFHYWFVTVKVVGPQPHQIKEKTINMRTPEAKFKKQDYLASIQYAIKERADEMGVDITAFEATLLGPCYAGHMTPTEFEGIDANEHNGSEQG